MFVVTTSVRLLQVYDEKNIRRRVYDALNVLMAMDIISKERKEIQWKGLPSSLQHDTEMLIVRVLWSFEDERRSAIGSWFANF